MKTTKNMEPLDGNEAVARVAYALSEVIAIYPITPASAMGEWADDWAAAGRPNLWGQVPSVTEMQSEAGAAGAMHGAVTTGALGTTFTASQGLLLMIPDMYKIAGELTPFVMHVAARAVATHALSIFGDHSDVMAVRQTGFALLASSSVQEAMDLAAVAHAASLESRLPFLHFFDGFRTSHEIQKVAPVSEETLRSMVSDAFIRRHRRNALTPDRPTLRGSAQNPDVFFQARERANPYYDAGPRLVQETMDRFAALTGRAYRLFDYYGDPEAERVVVLMGSGAGAAEEAVDALRGTGERVGLLKVRLYRPFSAKDFLAALPETTRSIAVLDRTKEPGALGEPLFLDVIASVAESQRWSHPPRIIGGRYGLSSKEFTPAMAAAVYAELAKETPKRRFTVGIKDDVSGLSLDYDPAFSTEDPQTVRAVFFGLGSDGTVGANKNTIKIIADQTPLNAQAYFVYDSKKSGSLTVSHLRFGPKPIRSSYLIREAGFVACHQESFVDRFDMLSVAAPGGVFLLNTAHPDRAWDVLPLELQQQVIAKRLRFYAIDAYKVAREAGLGRRISTVMQACFFSITGLLPGWEEAVKDGIAKSFGRKDKDVVEKNFRAVEKAAAGLVRVPVPKEATGRARGRNGVTADAPAYVRTTIGPMIAGKGDELPVSALPADGVFPTGTSRYEKRAIAQDVPVWEPDLCIQCNKCAFVCPHAAIRVKAYPAASLDGAASEMKSMDWKGREFPAGTKYTVQLSPEDCTGCTLCAVVCPAHDKKDPEKKSLVMVPVSAGLVERERKNFSRFLELPDPDRATLNAGSVKGSQLNPPLFEFSGACSGCGETPYIKLLTQLFGHRLLIANATGCSSIFGGNLPTAPWTVDGHGRGPAWANSLFEDNAEFGLGFRLALDQQAEHARDLLKKRAAAVGPDLARDILSADQANEDGIKKQRLRVDLLRSKLEWMEEPELRDLSALADTLVRKSVWIVGGDGWAYDIGFGGLDHVLRSGKKVRVLVLDTEVYSNTGGQASKATPRGAVARFAAAGKPRSRKDLALFAVTIGDVYVARVAFGANDTQTVKAFQEAEAHDGPALIVAYSPCIAHGIEMDQGLSQQKLAVETGYWPLFRFDPLAQGRPRLALDSGAPKRPLEDYIYREGRYRRLAEREPEAAKILLEQARADVRREWDLLSGLAGILGADRITESVKP